MATSASIGDEDPPSVARLREMLDDIERDADALAAQIAAAQAEARAAVDDPAAARLALAESVLPVSAKAELTAARDRYLEGLRRRRLRLQREGHVLAERTAELVTHAARLRDQRAALAERAAELRRRGEFAQSHLDAARAHRRLTLEWAAAVNAQRERTREWVAAVQRQAERLLDTLQEDTRPSAGPPPALANPG